MHFTKVFHITILGSVSLIFTLLSVIAAFKEQIKKSVKPRNQSSIDLYKGPKQFKRSIGYLKLDHT